MPLTLCHHLSELSKPRSQVPVEAKETEAQRGTDSCPRSPSPRQTAKPGLTQGPPNPCLLPSCKWSRKTSSSLHCSLLLPNPRFQFQAKLNQPNQPKRKKKTKNISWLNLSALSLPETRDSFLANLQEVGARRGRRFPPSTLCGQVRGTFLRLAALEAPAPAAAPSPSPGLLAGLRGPRCLSMHLSKRNAPSDPAFASHEF